MNATCRNKPGFGRSRNRVSIWRFALYPRFAYSVEWNDRAQHSVCSIREQSMSTANFGEIKAEKRTFSYFLCQVKYFRAIRGEGRETCRVPPHSYTDYVNIVIKINGIEKESFLQTPFAITCCVRVRSLLSCKYHSSSSLGSNNNRTEGNVTWKMKRENKVSRM